MAFPADYYGMAPYIYRTQIKLTNATFTAKKQKTIFLGNQNQVFLWASY